MKMIYGKTAAFAASALLVSMYCNDNPADSDDEADEVDPVILLTGGPDTIYVGDSWHEPGYTGTDNVDGTITDSIKVAGTVDTALEGRYVITYILKDNAGNSTSETRTVTVLVAPDLWAEYTFSGNTADSSGNGHDATVVGATLTGDRFGHSESAYAFSGAEGKYIVDSSISDFPGGNCAKTVSGWIKTIATTNQAFFGIGNAADGTSFQLALGPSGSGTQVVRINGWGNTNDWKTGVPASNCCNGKWHHLAVTYDTSNTTVYVDGTEKARTSQYRYRTNPQAGIVMIGNEIDYAGWPVNGSIDDIRIYSRALTPIQITALFRINGFTGDTTPPDTTHPDTTTPDRVTGLSYTISGTAGNLSLVLSWTGISSAFAYGVYFEEGTTVNPYSAFRVASKNSYTFTPGALTEGTQYAFAVTFTKSGGTESALSDPLVVEFKAQ
jgi:hypothetical protein